MGMFDAIDEAAALFDHAVAGLVENEFTEPSALPGWSRAHVIAHVALNAEGFLAAADGYRAGTSAYMYPDGTTQRDRDIDNLAAEPSAELLNRLTEANQQFIAMWSEGVGEFVCATAPGHPTFPSAAVPLRRLRELQVHLVDLDIDGVGPDDWLGIFVDNDLELQWPTVSHRTRERVSVVDELGQTWHTDPPAPVAFAVQADRRRLLAWVLDRAKVSGLPRLEAWTNRSKWEHIGQH